MMRGLTAKARVSLMRLSVRVLIEVGVLVKTELRFEGLSKAGVQS